MTPLMTTVLARLSWFQQCFCLVSGLFHALVCVFKWTQGEKGLSSRISEKAIYVTATNAQEMLLSI